MGLILFIKVKVYESLFGTVCFCLSVTHLVQLDRNIDFKNTQFYRS